MSLKTRIVATALALALLAGSAAHALPRSGRIAPTPAKPAGLFAPLWSWLYDLFLPAGPEGQGSWTAVWGEEGAIMDPDGKPKAGGMMDPNGEPANAGGMMDPNGNPESTTALDEGPIMDPNG